MRRENRTDEGFTLLEVIIALSLLAVISTSALVLFTRGMTTTSNLERRQAAIALASSGIDRARALSPAQLVSGRTQADVTTAWNASSAPDRGLTLPTWDAATPVGPLLLPITETPSVGNVTYTVRTLVGVCFRSRTAGTTGAGSAACDRAGMASAPLSTPTGLVRENRVVVEVLWTSVTGGSGCVDNACVYRVSTLVDGNSDQLWNVAAPPVQTSRSVTVTPRTDAADTTPRNINPMYGAGNVGPGTVVVVTAWSGAGQLTIDGKAYDAATNRSGSTFGYLPVVNDLGSYSLSYYLLNSDGQASDTVTMTLRISS
ncbi:prepilin-type N-terminal cleavage/methylation domain-containing protein [Kineococcus gynurae]|uniref:Prepilin-type N-terminal cleavage/methylation domain-containing protein n=1 Tax=Kineococcus gynurae TaxID=452979 RepID=A0ABV5LUT5_9ACTN